MKINHPSRSLVCVRSVNVFLAIVLLSATSLLDAVDLPPIRITSIQSDTIVLDSEKKDLPFSNGKRYVRIEAESSNTSEVVRTGLSTSTTISGYTGTGYVYGPSFNSSSDSILFKVNTTRSCYVDLVFRYYGYNGAKINHIYVNGVQTPINLETAATSNWNTQNVIGVQLQSGINNINVKKLDGYVHIDYLEVHPKDQFGISSPGAWGQYTPMETPPRVIDNNSSYDLPGTSNELTYLFSAEHTTLWTSTLNLSSNFSNNSEYRFNIKDNPNYGPTGIIFPGNRYGSWPDLANDPDLGGFDAYSVMPFTVNPQGSFGYDNPLWSGWYSTRYRKSSYLNKNTFWRTFYNAAWPGAYVHDDGYGNKYLITYNYGEDTNAVYSGFSGNTFKGDDFSVTRGISKGGLTRNVWTNVSGTLVSNIPLATTPNMADSITSFETPTNWADNYGTRVRGFLIPPSTGYYMFWIASDDCSELWLSNNSDSSNKVLIAYVNGWTNSREWSKYSSQKSSYIYLEQGVSYYIEALQKEGTGGDNLAVGWAKPGQSTSSPSEVIPGAHLAHWDDKFAITDTEFESSVNDYWTIDRGNEIINEVLFFGGIINHTNNTVSGNKSYTINKTIDCEDIIDQGSHILTNNSLITLYKLNQISQEWEPLLGNYYITNLVEDSTNYTFKISLSPNGSPLSLSGFTDPFYYFAYGNPTGYTWGAYIGASGPGSLSYTIHSSISLRWWGTQASREGGHSIGLADYGPFFWPNNGYLQNITPSVSEPNFRAKAGAGAAPECIFVDGNYLYVYGWDGGPIDSSSIYIQKEYFNRKYVNNSPVIIDDIFYEEGRLNGLKILRVPLVDCYKPKSFQIYYNGQWRPSMKTEEGVVIDPNVRSSLWKKGPKSTSLLKYPEWFANHDPGLNGNPIISPTCENFAVARLKIGGALTNYYISLEKFFTSYGTLAESYRQKLPAPKDSNRKLALRISTDLVNWSSPTIIDYRSKLEPVNGEYRYDLDWPIFLSNDGKSNYVIDAENFYIIGAYGYQEPSPSGVFSAGRHLRRIKMSIELQTTLLNTGIENIKKTYSNNSFDGIKHREPSILFDNLTTSEYRFVKSNNGSKNYIDIYFNPSICDMNQIKFYTNDPSKSFQTVHLYYTDADDYEYSISPYNMNISWSGGVGTVSFNAVDKVKRVRIWIGSLLADTNGWSYCSEIKVFSSGQQQIVNDYFIGWESPVHLVMDGSEGTEYEFSAVNGYNYAGGIKFTFSNPISVNRLRFVSNNANSSDSSSGYIQNVNIFYTNVSNPGFEYSATINSSLNWSQATNGKYYSDVTFSTKNNVTSVIVYINQVKTSSDGIVKCSEIQILK